VVRVTPAMQLSSKVGPPSYSAGIAGSAAAFVNIQRAEVDSIRMVPRRVPRNKIQDAIYLHKFHCSFQPLKSTPLCQVQVALFSRGSSFFVHQPKKEKKARNLLLALSV
jgi:hypothetical protein